VGKRSFVERLRSHVEFVVWPVKGAPFDLDLGEPGLVTQRLTYYTTTVGCDRGLPWILTQFASNSDR
jgi:hypothetical protein